MKTPIQQLIEQLNKVGIKLDEKLIEKYLEKEKQAIIEANDVGWKVGRKKENVSAQDYYNETFKQNDREITK